MLTVLVATLVLPAPQDPQGAPIEVPFDRGRAPLRRAADWATHRESVLAGLRAVMGTLPPREAVPALDTKVTTEIERPRHVRRTVRYTSRDGGAIPAYLYLPRGQTVGTGRRPAVLALHPTSPLGKGVVDGRGKRPNRAYARELADRGYVVLAPDYPSFGDYDHDFARDGYASGSMKGVADHARGIDLLQSLPQVDPERIGVIGHSLGGHNAVFLAVFDQRVKAVVSSCGWTPFRDYKGGDIRGWTSARYMPRLRTVFDLDPERVPFEFDEVVAALAPRPFLSSSPEHDDNFAVAGVRRATKTAGAVYARLGVPRNLVVVHPDCGHDFPPATRERAYRFLDAALGFGRPRVAGTKIFLEAPRAGVRTNAIALYTRPRGAEMPRRAEMMSLHSFQTRSDTADVAFTRFSTDNGRTWTAGETLRTHEPRPGGTLRRYLRAPFVADNGQLVAMILQGVLPGDDPLAGMRHWTLRYALSRDGGRTFWHEAPVVQVGAEFSVAHPLPGLRTGKNSMMIGAVCCLAIQLDSGEILQPVQITPLGEDGEYHNPGGGYTYHDAAVLIGRFQDAGTIDWRVSERVRGDPKRSTRGLLEPTVLEARDGRILMVMRGSNDRRGRIPGHKWFAVSKDKGRTWTDAAPWRYRSGRTFFSPSACSQLLRHSNGRAYWIGNICPQNSTANHPRHPLVIVEVEEASLCPIEATATVIDRRRKGDAPRLQLSNFCAYEDRETRDILVHCTPIGRPHRLSADRATEGLDWTGDALVYRVQVPR